MQPVSVQIFPSLSRKAQDQGMELVDVDRRWGIPEQEISKIDKSFFASNQATLKTEPLLTLKSELPPAHNRSSSVPGSAASIALALPSDGAGAVN